MKKSNSMEFLLNLLFGEERTIRICAHVAYRDVQRNLAGIGELKQKKLEWREKIESLIDSCIETMFTLELSQQKSFDDWHQKTCEEICRVSNEYNVHKKVKWMGSGFAYGLAQKWLNMTLKNMLVMDCWEAMLEPIEQYLHVPVDSYIMKASVTLGIELKDKKGKYNLYKEGVSKPWSQWNYSDYIKFQEELRKAVEHEGKYKCPMDWEFDAWLTVKNG